MERIADSYQQDPLSPFGLSCYMCGEVPAQDVTREGIFHCDTCWKSARDYDTETRFDDYCVSCGVDERMKGRETCADCYSIEVWGSYEEPSYWQGRDQYDYIDYEPEPLKPVEDDLELLQAVR